MTECYDYSDRDLNTPCMYINHDLENYYAQVEMAGVKKDDIELQVTENGLCISGNRGEKEISGCWMLAHPVEVEKVKAKYNNGLLDLTIPLKNPVKNGKKVKIE